METDTYLEVTDCFPFATNLADEAEQEHYQIETMKCLRESNIDSNTVGWYQTCAFDAFVSSSLTEAQLEYQATIPNSIVLIVDIPKSTHLYPSVRAFQIRSNYAEQLLKASSGSAAEKFESVFSELPVKFALSILDKMFLFQEQAAGNLPTVVPLSSYSEQSKVVSSLSDNILESVDDGIAEVGKLQYNLRSLMKQPQNNRSRKGDQLQSFRTSNESTISALGHTSLQLLQFEKLLSEYSQVVQDMMRLD
jgi:translation initiation factor 3 subunit H